MEQEPKIANIEKSWPIMVSYGEPNEETEPEITQRLFDLMHTNRDVPGVHNVDWSSNPPYVISPLDGIDKFSMEFYPCIGVVVCGKDKNTGAEISFLCHCELPFRGLKKTFKGKFEGAIRDMVHSISERCDSSTIDAVMIGGNYLPDNEMTDSKVNHIEAIKYLGGLLVNEGLKPVVVGGPKLEDARDDVYYDTKNRRLYLMRDPFYQNGRPDKFRPPYNPQDIDQVSKEWKHEFEKDPSSDQNN